jgi:hypothetical protein
VVAVDWIKMLSVWGVTASVLGATFSAVVGSGEIFVGLLIAALLAAQLGVLAEIADRLRPPPPPGDR